MSPDQATGSQLPSLIVTSANSTHSIPEYTLRLYSTSTDDYYDSVSATVEHIANTIRHNSFNNNTPDDHIPALNTGDLMTSKPLLQTQSPLRTHRTVTGSNTVVPFDIMLATSTSGLDMVTGSQSMQGVDTSMSCLCLWCIVNHLI